jgi:hypothetical protein
MAVFVLQWRYGFLWSDEGWLWYIGQRTALGQANRMLTHRPYTAIVKSPYLKKCLGRVLSEITC